MPAIEQTHQLRSGVPGRLGIRARPKTTGAQISAVKHTDDLFCLLARSSAVFASSLRDEQILRQIARLAVPRVADVCKIEVVDREPRLVEIAGAPRDRPALVERSLASGAPGGDGDLTPDRQVLASGRPILIGDCRSSKTPTKAMRRARSLMVVPLVGRAKILGVLSFASVRSGRLFDLADLSAAIALASRGALALEMSRLYRETSEAMRERGADLSRLSHDLKNVLMSVNLTTETLLRSAPANERRRGWSQLERIRSGVMRMNRMVDDLRDRHCAPRQI